MSAKTRSANYSKPWIRDQLVLDFNLYCRIPVQKTKANNPEVKKLAKLLWRSPASVARNLGNLGSFHPELKRRNISGLSHGSKLDRQVWDEFHENWNELVVEANDLRGRWEGVESEGDAEIVRPEGPSERQALRTERIHQAFFREAILGSYNVQCCITGNPVRECLIACHIVPWSARAELRSDPSNGLCLSATFERLFDSGLVTVTAEWTVRVSSRLLELKSGPVGEQIGRYHEAEILRPQRFLPSRRCLEWHWANVFCE